MDKGFSQYVRHFRNTDPVAVVVAAQIGIHQESSWTVSMRQEKRRCVLIGRPCSSGLSTAFWKAMAELTIFEPFPGVFEAYVFVPEEFMDQLLAAINRLAIAEHIPGSSDAPTKDQEPIAEFIRGRQKFG
jgi:hypothetical protein